MAKKNPIIKKIKRHKWQTWKIFTTHVRGKCLLFYHTESAAK